MSESTTIQALKKVVIVDDDPKLAESLRGLLEKEALDVSVGRSAEEGLELVRTTSPDLVVLDLMLPGIDGLEACRRLRTFSDAYVIMLTALSSETDRLVGLSVGADDYLVKPFYPRELVARIRAMQRRPRANEAGPAIHRFGKLEVDGAARRVSVDGEEVRLSRTEFDLLEALASHSRVSLSRRQLLELVWGESWYGDDHVIDVHMSNLRRKLGDPSYIETVRGFGYRMAAPG